MDGNNTGAVRGINTRTDYVMGINAMTVGVSTEASGDYSFAEGADSRATGNSAHAEGGSVASGINSHAEGFRTQATGSFCHAEGIDTVSTTLASHAEGHTSTATGESSHAEGGSDASGSSAHSEGLRSQAQGDNSHAEGHRTTAVNASAHAEGNMTTAQGAASHAEGNTAIAIGDASHAEGFGTTASAVAAHAQGFETTAEGFTSHTEGYQTSASHYSHAEGYQARVPGEISHAEGLGTNASGFFSHAEGAHTSDSSLDGVHIMGRYGAADTPYSWFLANGLDAQNPGLSAKILRDGNAYIDVAWNGGGADYAELYETESGQPIEPGCFVTFAGASDKIRLAQSYDEYVLGVVSKTPGFVAGAGELRWKNKYKTDEWGGIVYEDVTVPEIKDKEGKVVIPARVESRPVADPSYDPNRPYVPRMNRPEWLKVGLLGAIRVHDDGTLTPGGYCRPGMNGIATAAHTGYRVLKRTGVNQALILFK